MKRASIFFLLPAFFLFTLITACSKSGEEPSNRSITIKLVHGPEIRAYLSAMKEQFYLTNPRLEDGTRVLLEFIPDLGVPSARHIADGETKAEGWLAPSSGLVNYVNSTIRFLGAHQTSCVQLFASPVVLAVPPSLESAIGAREQQYDWERVFGDRATPNDGGTIALRYSHGSPQASVSGLAALMQLAYFAANNEATAGAELQWNDELASKLRAFESKVSQYSLSESYLLERTSHSVPSRIRLTLTTEQQVALFNQHAGRSSPSLIALYPSRGAVWQDYTLCHSDADWMTPSQHAGLALFQKFLSGDRAQSAAADHGFRPSISRKVDPKVLGPNQGVNLNLPTSSFPTTPAAVVNSLLSNWEDLIHPVAMVVSIDTSGSMEGDYLRGVKDSVREVLARLPSHTKAALTTFAGEASLKAPFTEDMGAIIPILDGLQAQGGSAAYDGLKFALETVSAPELNEYRRVVLFITDGEGKNSEVTRSALESYLDRKIIEQDLNIIIVTIRRDDSNYSDIAQIARNADAVYRESTIGDLQGLLQDLLKSL